jgi:hypothetical protein
MKWVKLAQDRFQCGARVKTVKHSGSIHVGEFLEQPRD